MSRPTSGSVTAKQAFSLPAISGGRKRRFCSSLPNTTTGCSPKIFMCTAEAPENPAPDCATACMTIAASVMPRPLPPYSSGIATPSQPASAIARWNSCGNAPSVSFCSQYSSPKRSHSRATASRISSCSAVNAKLIVGLGALDDKGASPRVGEPVGKDLLVFRRVVPALERGRVGKRAESALSIAARVVARSSCRIRTSLRVAKQAPVASASATGESRVAKRIIATCWMFARR